MVGNKKHFALFGATGLVGSKLLDMMLENDQVGKVTVYTRTVLKQKHPKLAEREVDLEEFKEKELPPNLDAVFCCIGTTMAQAGGKDAFRRVDYDYVMKLAVFTQRQKIPQFHVISAAGANPKSWIFYNKVKGRMESELHKLDKIRSIYIYRPSMLLGNRDEFRFGESLGKVFMKIFDLFIPKSGKAIRDEEVALNMLVNALKPEKGIHMVTNKMMINRARD